MRLRVTVRRNGIPDFPLVWAVDTTSSPTVYQLLEQINEVAPVADDDQWGLEDYAVEIRGSNGVNYECLHYQLVQSVMKDEDEVVIRPLLHQDLRVRDISGRHQISTDGRHIYDGLPLGRPKLKRIMNRPAIKIQPRKRQRLLNNEEVDEEPRALEHEPKDESHTEKNQQLILHGDFEDTDSEEDGDFVPEEDEDSEQEESEEDIESEKEINAEAEMNQELSKKSDEEDSQETESIEPALADVPDPAFRAMIRKLHSAFPISPLGVCKFILQGTEGDMGEAYEALNRGFVPIKPKSAITETSEEQDTLPTNIHSAEATSDPEELENEDSMQVEADLTADSLLAYYDQNGLPQGSIKSGKALKFMADAIKSSPFPKPPPRPESRRLFSAMKRKRKPFTQDEGLAHGLSSTPAIDVESQDVEASSEDSSDSSSEEEDAKDEGSSGSDSDGSSGEISSDDSSDDDENIKTADHPPKDVDVNMTEDSSSSDEETSDNSSSNGHAPKEADMETDESSSSSNSESSSDSSSDDEAPEECSSRLDTLTTTTKRIDAISSPSNKPMNNQKTTQGAPPGKGKNATRARNKRRQYGNAFQRFQKKGILPAGTTIAEFCKMEIEEHTSPEEALAKLKQVRTAKLPAELSNHEFERKRKELLDSIASGGVEVGFQVARATSRSPSISAQHIQIGDEVPDSQSLQAALSVSSEAVEGIVAPQIVQAETKDIEIPRPSTAPEVPEMETSLSSPAPQPEPSQKDAARPGRSRLDMGAGKRLLFGALGIKTPKTKADEEKVKNDLMKFARPLTTAKPLEEHSTAKSIVEEDPEAWREKLNYRAVECVQEGIELSEPPFPFVQRWDPQQKSSWSQKGNRGGKRKQAQRDQEQYYDDTGNSKKQKQRKRKRLYAEEQEYLEASYEPSYQDDTIELQYDDSTQLENSPNDINDEVSQQLMQDMKAPQAAVSQGPEDLASLPEDPSSLPELQDGQAKVGMTIAFKSLECSSATNWAPRISGYRTAIVIALGENGLLQLSLAMRDRQQSQKRYDKITGERIYNKFEVPDDEEMEDEDDGMLDLSFCDMFEPKIVQQPPQNLSTGATQSKKVMEDDFQDKIIADEESQPKDGDRSEALKKLSHEEELAEAQLSHVTETPIHSDAPDLQPEDEEVPAKGSVPENQPDILKKALEQISTVDVTGPQNEVLPITPTREISDENREKINNLMKDAGFRLSIPSSVLRDVRPDGLQSIGDATDFEKLKNDISTPADLEKVYSPKFHAFDSSTPTSKQRDNSKSTTKLASSPPWGTQHTWETVSEYGKPGLEVAEGEERSVVAEESSSWITEGQSAYPSSPPAKRTVEPIIEKQVPLGPLGPDPAFYNEATNISANGKPEERSRSQMTDPDTDATRNPSKTKRKKKRKHASPSKALDLWQQFEPVEVKTSPETGQSSKESALGLDGTADANSNKSIQYPKLSIGSSFTSQVTDVGRQLEHDFNFDESPILVGDDNQNVSEMETDAPSLDTSDFDKSWKGVGSEERGVADNSNEDGSFIGLDSESKPYKSTNRTTEVSKTVPGISEDEHSSDDSFQLLEALSPQRTIKHEKLTPPKSKSVSKNGSDQKKRQSIPIDDDSDDSNQSTPKASQRYPQLSEARSSKSRSSEEASSQPCGSVPSASQPPPSQLNQKSIIIDLCESDSEPEAGEESDDIQPARFKPTMNEVMMMNNIREKIHLDGVPRNRIT